MNYRCRWRTRQGDSRGHPDFAVPPIDGTLAAAELREAFALTYPKGDAVRWFMECPVHDGERIWIVTKMWAGTPNQSLNARKGSRQNSLASGTKRSRSTATAEGMYVGQCPGGT